MGRNVTKGPTPTERVRASRIRAAVKAGTEVDSEDAAWFADYEAAREVTAQSRGASQSRKVSYTEEESQAVGEGDAAASAAVHGAMVTAEGQRLDHIIALSMASLKDANELLMTMTRNMMKRTEGFEQTLINMMNAQAALVNQHRENALRATEAEIRAIEAESERGEEKDEINEAVKELLPALLEAISNRKK